ncbi:MAG: hypothetical protein Kow0022_11610 [Phycisphaerales bacterium]
MDAGTDSNHPEFFGDEELPSKTRPESTAVVEGGSNRPLTCSCVPDDISITVVDDLSWSAYKDVCDTTNLIAQDVDEAYSRGCVIIAVAGMRKTRCRRPVGRRTIPTIRIARLPAPGRRGSSRTG